MTDLSNLYQTIRIAHTKLNALCEDILPEINRAVDPENDEYWDLHDQIRRNISSGDTHLDYLRSAVESDDREDFITCHRDLEKLLNWTTNIFNRILDEYTTCDGD